jgi:hypothetical protein
MLYTQFQDRLQVTHFHSCAIQNRRPLKSRYASGKIVNVAERFMLVAVQKLPLDIYSSWHDIQILVTLASVQYLLDSATWTSVILVYL